MRKRTGRASVVLVLSVVVVSLLLCNGVANAEGGQPAKNYPPYPDVWGHAKGLGELCKADDGDFYFISSTFKKAGTESSYRNITALFGQSVVEVSSKEADEVRGDRKPLAGVGVLRCYGLNDYPQSLSLRDGFTVRRACFSVSGTCSYPFQGVGIEVRDKDQRIVAQKIFLFFQGTPRKKYLPAPKVVDIAGEIVERVVQLRPKLVPLEDETFLVYAEAVILRLDQQLTMRFSMSEDRLFAIDPSVIDKIYEQATKRLDPGSLAWHQAVQDAVAELLEKLRKEKRP